MKSIAKHSLLLILIVHGSTSLFGMNKEQKVYHVPTVGHVPVALLNTDLISAALNLTNAEKIEDSDEALENFKELLNQNADPNIPSLLFNTMSAAAYLNFLIKPSQGEKVPKHFPDQKIIAQNKSNIEKALALLPK